jgi:serine/threonine protein kinase
MSLAPGQQVLRRIFTLRRSIFVGTNYQLWEADLGDGEGILIKAWPFLRDEPSPVERNLWDRELRILYRLASTPEAERRLVTLIDAAVDRDAQAFVLALKVPGLDRLSDVLTDRRRYGWVSDMNDVSKRVALWRGALRLIEGLAHVHRFRSVHRAIKLENVFLDSRRGPDSLRLGGFEWSVRLGDRMSDESRSASPMGRANASLNADWRDLGLVLSGLFGVPHNIVSSGDVEHAVRSIQELPRLTEDEKSYLRSLLGANGYGPLDSDDIAHGCTELINSLERPASLRPGDHLGVVVALRNRLGPTDFAIWIADSDPSVNATDEVALRSSIQDDLSDAEIVSSGEAEQRSYFLKGRQRPYRLFQFKRSLSEGDSEVSWNLGYLGRAEYIDERRVTKRAFPLPSVIRVFTVQDAHASYPEICKTVRPWESILPAPPEPAGEAQAQIAFLRKFLQVTNEIERAIRKTEIYPFLLIRKWADSIHEYAIVQEGTRTDRLAMFDPRNTPSMISYLSNEDAKGQRATEVYLGTESDLEFERRVVPAEFWSVQELPPGSSRNLGPTQVLLRRFARQEARALPTPPETGFLRTQGMFAQVKLIDRREDAIDLVGTHTFLQRALVLPDTVYMDTGIDDLPLPLPEETKFDHAKTKALKQIWRTRPVYYLQGPPGTGKTTLVAQLLRQIYEDDPSCQVLLTAQAHSAVDHLRDEVSKFVELRRNEDPDWIAPLAVRLRKPKPDEVEPQVQDPAYPSSVARHILERSVRLLEGRANPKAHIQAWLEFARAPSDNGDFEQLVRRSANFVYCTSTAGDLLELAQSHETFDWSIIEEAGKAHGFDLVLPLQTGHRWLLIGDQNQLPPYRDKDFARGLDRLDKICGSKSDLRRFWDEMSATERQKFTDDAKRWLFFFRELFATAKGRILSETPLVGMLTEQHRMHPRIGDMISHAFYDGKITNGTEDQSTRLPLGRVLHPFCKPAAILDRSIVWVDVALRSQYTAQREEVEGMHLNNREIEAIRRVLATIAAPDGRKETTAVLTPYRRQLSGLRSSLRQRPPWTVLPEGYEHLAKDPVGVFTVDSFQGRQASVVIVSLVRNNSERDIGRALGFLREHERMNVMLSRSEKLLVLVGNWEFFRTHLAAQSRDKGQPYAQLASLADWLENAFNDGRAHRVPVDQFETASPP